MRLSLHSIAADLIRPLRAERGASLVEYALTLALVTLSLIHI